MPRVKRGTISLKRRKKVLAQAKGWRFGRSTKEREAIVGILHAGVHAFNHRRDKKGNARALWQTKISAGVKPFELSYSKFMGLLKKKNIELDRKILAGLAETNSETFAKVVEEAKK